MRQLRSIAVGIIVGLAVGLVGPVSAHDPASEIAQRDELITAQEALLNVYRCKFGIDTEVVPGGCVDGKPLAGASEVSPTPTTVVKPGNCRVTERAGPDVVSCSWGHSKRFTINRWEPPGEGESFHVPGGDASLGDHSSWEDVQWNLRGFNAYIHWDEHIWHTSRSPSTLYYEFDGGETYRSSREPFCEYSECTPLYFTNVFANKSASRLDATVNEGDGRGTISASFTLTDFQAAVGWLLAYQFS
ncbi:MAG: hypothetical protein OXN95_12915 [bacterium]|nr:hypothetical protein [bacterium]